MKVNFTEFFKDRDVELPSLQKALDVQTFAALPTTPNDNFLFYHGISSPEPRDYNFDDDVKIFMMAAGKLIGNSITIFCM